MTERIAAQSRLDMANINAEWELLVSWLPKEGEVSEVDVATLVADQWEKSRLAYSNMGLTLDETPVIEEIVI